MTPMRRSDREVHGAEHIRAILEQSKVCQLAMVDDGRPYLVTMNFGYEQAGEELTLYFHSAGAGRKLDILRKNSAVCFTVVAAGVPDFVQENPCASSVTFASVVGEGTAEIVEDAGEKCKGLSLLMQRAVGRAVPFTPAQAAGVTVLRLRVTNLSAKAKMAPHN